MSTESTGPSSDDDAPDGPTGPSHRGEPDAVEEPAAVEEPDAVESAGVGGRTLPIVLIVVGVVMLLLALGIQLPGPAYVGVVPLFYGLGTLSAGRTADRVTGQRRIALFSGLATVILVFAIGTHLALAGDDLELDLGFGVLATVLAAALTGIHLAAKRGTDRDSA